MDLDNLIPFGRFVETGDFADVGDVSKGRACGCICPSCQTPLVARQGTVKAWHFAHASHGAYEQTTSDCGYSFEVSARLMALQLLRHGMVIQMPDCYGTIDGFEFDVAPAQLITLDGVRVETAFSGVVVDAVAAVNNAPFVIYVTHWARALPPMLKTPSDPTASVIAIDVSNLRKAFADGHAAGKRYTEILNRFLESDQPSKKWVFHPDFRRKHALAQEQQVARERERKLRRSAYREQRPVVDNQFLAALAAPIGPRSWCIRCQIEWSTPASGYNRCPRCKSDRHISALS